MKAFADNNAFMLEMTPKELEKHIQDCVVMLGRSGDDVATHVAQVKVQLNAFGQKTLNLWLKKSHK